MEFALRALTDLPASGLLTPLNRKRYLKMTRHLILVVHGIGEQRPGETVDAVLGGALGQHRADNRTDALDITDETVELPETTFAQNRMPKTFPVHYRRVREAKTEDGPETTFAEVFWADKSPAPAGFFWTLLALIKLLLGIGYLAMDNAENNRGWLSNLVIHGFTWVFFGGIAAVNAMLLVGVITLLAEGRMYQIAEFAREEVLNLPVLSAGMVIVAIAVICLIWSALILMQPRQTYMLKVFARGLGVWAILAIAFRNLRAAGYLNFDLLPIAAPSLPADMATFIELGISVMTITWVLAVFLCLLSYLIWIGEAVADRMRGETQLTDPAIPPLRGQRRIFAPICSAMILLWTVLSSAFWLTVERFVGQASISVTESAEHAHAPSGVLVGAFDAYFETAVSAMTVATLLFGVLIVVAAVLVLVRLACRQTLYKDSHWLIRRLLLSGWFQIVFGLSTLAIAGLMFNIIDPIVREHQCVMAELSTFCWRYFEFVDTPFMFSIALVGEWVKDFESWRELVAILLLGLATLFSYFSSVVAAGLGIFRDIVAYATVTRCNIWAPKALSYRLRSEIEDRFKRVLKVALDHDRPDRLTVISHSQGTVVATRCLGAMLDDPGINFPADIRLVTMGSPVTHIYRQYFFRDFDTKFRHCDDGKWSISEGSDRCVDWHNIFRTDDFVGTRISYLEALGKNHKVSAAGHPGYFGDREVWAHLKEKLEIELTR